MGEEELNAEPPSKRQKLDETEKLNEETQNTQDDQDAQDAQDIIDPSVPVAEVAEHNSQDPQQDTTQSGEPESTSNGNTVANDKEIPAEKEEPGAGEERLAEEKKVNTLADAAFKEAAREEMQDIEEAKPQADDPATQVSEPQTRQDTLTPNNPDESNAPPNHKPEAENPSEHATEPEHAIDNSTSEASQQVPENAIESKTEVQTNEKVIVDNSDVLESVSHFERRKLGCVTYAPHELLFTRFDLFLNSTVHVRVSRGFVNNKHLPVVKREVWGTEVYTDDSDIVGCLFHEGFLDEKSEDEAIKKHVNGKGDLDVVVLILPVLKQYQGSYRHGLNSRSWLSRHDGVSIKILDVKDLEQDTSNPAENEISELGLD